MKPGKCTLHKSQQHDLTHYSVTLYLQELCIDAFKVNGKKVVRNWLIVKDGNAFADVDTHGKDNRLTQIVVVRLSDG